MPSKKEKIKRPTEKELKEIINSQYKKTDGYKKTLWIFVIVFLLIILFLWGWATKNNFQNINSKTGSDEQLLKDTKKTWDEIFAETKTKEQEKINLQNTVNNIINEIAKSFEETTSTTTSTTLSTSTTDISTTTNI